MIESTTDDSHRRQAPRIGARIEDGRKTWKLLPKRLKSGGRSEPDCPCKLAEDRY
ncbi:MAG: hypothetical protein MUC46_10255 [Desulfobacterales bacterium]|nr:hypothetical protein [Desulfobacterales bacterium]